MEPEEVNEETVEQVLRDNGALTGSQDHDQLLLASLRLLAALGFDTMQCRTVHGEPLHPGDEGQPPVGYMIFMRHQAGMVTAFGSLTPAGAAVNALECFLEGSTCHLCGKVVALIATALGHSPVSAEAQDQFCQYTVQGEQWTPQCFNTSHETLMGVLFPGGRPGHPSQN